MNLPEPLHYAIAQHLLGDVASNLAKWQDRLDIRRADAVAVFAKDFGGMIPPAGVSLDDYVEAQIDIVVDRWCQQRDAFTREIVAMLNPETVAASEHLGVAAELGRLIGLYLDNAVTDLDRELRTLVERARN
ncbi:hypothetical protein E2E30_09005 [Sphingomonas sp. AAP5]|uniref:hypothetical protein n=1 Tax=Sphingomonas sp. AAP5 TaxID=1523415 RepID=UPI00105757DB|nr:hypothetical protein [Sphingomonas sp. AAP5]QBM75895.1 hypothetical protein E2E30_09005 [Sphingomonas sp. AAP5]